ncbi:MAG: hypothetical protein E7051_05980 [Lentisphaerae bacterium]|nr:hypothetical protein [Lentisphaerota bacterium]
MKHIWISLLLFCAAALYASVSVRTAELSVDNGKLVLKNKIGGDWKSAPLTMSLYDGKAKKFIKLPSPEISENNGKITVVYKMPDLTWNLTFSARERVILGESVFVNKGNEELFIEQIFSLAPDWKNKKLNLWDGFGSSRPVTNGPVSREGIKGAVLKHVASSAIAFAATAVFSDKNAISIGHVTFDPVSYTAVEYIPSVNKYSYSQRFVISPRQTVPLRHVIAASESAYGAAERIIQQHYDSFPEVWAVVGGQDNPYAWGNCAHYRNWWSTPRPEESRRLYYTHEWAYAPYFRAGDMVIKDELMKYTPDNPIEDKNRAKFGGVSTNYKHNTAEEYRKIRKENYLKHGKRYGWMFYNSCSGTWCERQLAEKHYPDSLTKDKKTVTLIKGWSTGHDWEVRVFPMGTSWAKVFEEDMKFLTEELDLPGFALDCGGGGAYYRGPAVKKPLAGRAWDNEGVFIDQSVAVNHVVDYIHSLRPAPNQLTVHNNGSLKGDICMLERPFLNVAAHRSMLPLYRWFIGPRPGNVHGHGFLFKEMMPDWRNRTTPEFIDLIQRLSDYQIMNQFKWGLNQTFVTFYGNPQQVYIIPESLELIRAGWQSSTPVAFSKDLYVPYCSRYGKGANTFFFFGNTSKKDSAGTLSIDNIDLTADGKPRFVFLKKLRNKSETVNNIADNFTKVDTVLPSRVPVLYETVCGFENAPAAFSAVANGDKKLEKMTFSVKVDKAFSTSAVFRKIRFFHLAAVDVDGKTVSFKDNGNEYKVENVDLKANSVLTIRYKSDFFNITQDEILSFPFVDANKKLSFRIHVPKSDEEAMKLSKRFDEYFAFCYKYKVLPEGGTPPVSRNDSSLNRKDAISLQIVPDKANTIEKLANGAILIRAKNTKTLEEMIRQFAFVMDIKFPHIFKFYGSMGIYGDQLAHFGMNGKYIPERRYFE